MLERKLQASDKRAGDGFGDSVAVDAEERVAAVGARLHTDAATGAVEAGAVYVYRRLPLVAAGLAVSRPAFWNETELAWVPAVDAHAQQWFGRDVALSAGSMLVGAPGDGGPPALRLPQGIGAAVAADVRWSRVQMASSVVPVLESGGFSRLEIPVRRRPPLDAVLSVAFATSDGDARGIGQAKAAACRALAPQDRGQSGCGDFERTAGVLTFPAGITRAYVVVPVTEDRCFEAGSKVLLVQVRALRRGGRLARIAPQRPPAAPLPTIPSP